MSRRRNSAATSSGTSRHTGSQPRTETSWTGGNGLRPCPPVHCLNRSRPNMESRAFPTPARYLHRDKDQVGATREAGWGDTELPRTAFAAVRSSPLDWTKDAPVVFRLPDVDAGRAPAAEPSFRLAPGQV